MAESSPKERLAHPCFPQPEDSSVKVWRYLDISKFIWMLSFRKLYLSRIDLLGDPHEGSTPKALAEARDRQIKELTKNAAPVDMGRIVRNLRRATYVNCWHLGNSESEAMWRLYCPSNHGVALQTTYGALVSSIEPYSNLYIGKVTYIDYETQWFPAGNILYPVMHKRLSFAHEQEVRLVTMKNEYIGTDAVGSPLGEVVEWPIEQVVQAVYINPYAPEYYRDVVISVLRTMAPALQEKTQWSSMRGEPVY